MTVENKNPPGDFFEDLAKRIFPSNPDIFIRFLNRERIKRAKQMNSLANEAGELRRLGLSSAAEKIEIQMAQIAAGEIPA